MADVLFDWFGFDQTRNLLLIQHKQSSWNQVSKTGGQLYSDASPYKVSEYSVIQPMQCQVRFG